MENPQIYKVRHGACLTGYKMFFVIVPSLINQLKNSKTERKLQPFELKFVNCDLVIIDEFRHIPFDKKGAELLIIHL